MRLKDFVGIELIATAQKKAERRTPVLGRPASPHRVALGRWPFRVIVRLPIARDVGDPHIPEKSADIGSGIT